MSDSSFDTSEKKENEPPHSAICQQCMLAWHPVMDPIWVSISLAVFATFCIPIGHLFYMISNNIIEYTQVYDSHDHNLTCRITEANKNHSCTLNFRIKENMSPPVLLYYEITNFNQNHNVYMNSRDDAQLLGESAQTELGAKNCHPLNTLINTKTNSTVYINPCGLVANTFFNDVISLTPNVGYNYSLIEDGIAWQSDIDYKFRQPAKFKEKMCTSCDDAECICQPPWTCSSPYYNHNTDTCHLYSYPNDNITQYLYETYPDIISPLDGVQNEHFIVWMRVAAFSKFRKLYGYFDTPIDSGTSLSFNILANWDISRFQGSKALVLTTTSFIGGKRPQLGIMIFTIGYVSLFFAFVIGLKHLVKPRKMGDMKYLRYV